VGPVPGSYVLVCELTADVTIQVGALGTILFMKGEYAYVGSAMGSGGLQARLTRHLISRSRPKHWHIDYLLSQANVTMIFWLVSKTIVECGWAGALSLLSARNIPGFGASDCGCDGHLFSLGSQLRSEHLPAVLWEVTNALKSGSSRKARATT
jgi:Uri superfamily endonuclease